MREDPLTTLFRERAEPQKIEYILSPLDPFYQVMDSKQYPFVPDSHLNPTEIQQTIEMATGLKAEKIVFIALIKPASTRPQDKEAYDVETLSATLISRFKEQLIKALQGDKETCLALFTLAGQVGKFREVFRPVVKGVLGSASLNISSDDVEDNLLTVLFYYLAFALLNEWEFVDQLRPLLRLLPAAIPLGERKDGSNTWIVLCA